MMPRKKNVLDAFVTKAMIRVAAEALDAILIELKMRGHPGAALARLLPPPADSTNHGHAVAMDGERHAGRVQGPSGSTIAGCPQRFAVSRVVLDGCDLFLGPARTIVTELRNVT
jgi:hypothetical protein